MRIYVKVVLFTKLAENTLCRVSSLSRYRVYGMIISFQGTASQFRRRGGGLHEVLEFSFSVYKRLNSRFISQKLCNLCTVWLC